jgi:hypothetical protein
MLNITKKILIIVLVRSYRSLPCSDGDIQYSSGDEDDIYSYDQDNPTIEVDA